MNKIPFDEMFQLALAIRQNAYAPFSKFSVGACILTDSGRFYTGCNVENTSFPLGQCAETNAIGTMVCHGERKIAAAVIIADCEPLISPCGGCRQQLAEFSDPDTMIYLCNPQGRHQLYKMAELLPYSFKFDRK